MKDLGDRARESITELDLAGMENSMSKQTNSAFTLNDNSLIFERGIKKNKFSFESLAAKIATL